MNRKTVLMGSVSAVALAAGATVAHAQDATVPDGFMISVEGGGLFGPNTVAEDKLGSGPFGSAGVVNIEDNMGYRAAISIGRQLDPYWDIRVTGALNGQVASNSDASYSSGSSGYFGSVITDFDYETLDFEVGYRPMLTDKMQVRLFAGLRGMHYNDSVDKTGTQFSGPDKIGYDLAYNEEFLGIGPRVGVEGSMPLGDSMFGVSGMLAGGAIFGTARTSASYAYHSGGFTSPTVDESREEQITIYDLEASLGLDMHVTDDMTVTLGYRAEKLWGVDTQASGGSGGLGDGTRFSHGPTLKVTGYFD